MKRIKDIRKRAGEIDYGSDESVRIMKKMTPGVKEGITQKDVDAGKMKPPSQGRLDAIRKDYEAKKKAKDDAISRLRGDKTEGKLTFAKVRKGLYKAAKTMGDVQAVRKGKVGKRVKRRILGKLAGKALGALTK